jgi:ammonia channel protein AmtB
MRIFLFGSIAGLVAAKILGKEHSQGHEKYYSQYQFQAFALLGAIFVWILLPWLSVI